ncbi:Dehydrin [Dillenia turbinata]|uniref:Dehydrin n=1 Tax=Dillenia turbinata TaxID=194707 RepID=A0AAN8ZFJ0_9MAGN
MAEEYRPDHHHSHEHEHESHGEYEEPKVVTTSEERAGVESTDRGLFDFMGKKEKPYKEEEVLVTEFDKKVQVSEYEPPKEEYKEEKKEGFLAKLDRSDSSSSSIIKGTLLMVIKVALNVYISNFSSLKLLQSSDEEEGENGEKKKKKKGLKEKIKEKISGDHKKEEEKKYEHHEHEHKHEHYDHDTNVPIEKEEVVYTETVVVQPEEKKGFLEKIKEKLPGQAKKPEEVPPPPPVVEYAPPPPEQHCHDGEVKEKKGFLEKIKEKLPGYHHKTEDEKEKEKEKECASH